MAKKEKDGLEIDQGLSFHRHLWVVQRVGWALMALIVAAALLGFFGPGLLGKSIAGEKSAELWLEYDRFDRAAAEATLRIHFAPINSPDKTTRIWLSRDYLEGIQLLQVTPEPQSVEAGGDRMTYVFSVSDMSQPTAVTFQFEPEQVGRLQGQVGLSDGQSLSFSQFIYP